MAHFFDTHPYLEFNPAIYFRLRIFRGLDGTSGHGVRRAVPSGNFYLPRAVISAFGPRWSRTA
jgi:hypothetical protein